MADADGTQDHPDDADLRDIVRGSPLQLGTLAEDSIKRFHDSVHGLLESRAQEGWKWEDENADTAVFVHVEFPRNPFSSGTLRAGAPAPKRVLDLGTKSAPLFGRIYFLAQNGVDGAYVELPVDEDDLSDWLEQGGLAERPVVIARRASLKASFRRNFVNDASVVRDIRSEKFPISLETLEESLNRFHRDKLETPTNAEVWAPDGAPKYYPVPKAELLIQKFLHEHLKAWFRGDVRIETETSVRRGRIDVSILLPGDPDGPTGLTYWATIELKVARSFSAPGPESKKGPRPISQKIRARDLRKGFRQAHEFMYDREVEQGLLEIYDMRKDKEMDLLADASVVKERGACNPKIRATVRALYGSSEEARQCEPAPIR